MRFGSAKLAELARTGKRGANDLHGFRVLRIGRVGLEILLARVRGIRDAAVDEIELFRESRESLAFLVRQQVLDLEQHFRRALYMSGRNGALEGVGRGDDRTDGRAFLR